MSRPEEICGRELEKLEEFSPWPGLIRTCNEKQ